MDNEEIKKLLQELKKNSDESTAVRSEVVKIHFDTPAEAARRRKAKARAEAEEARRKREEEEKARAAEEARRLEAERMAREVVEEAKLQAKAGFSSDLEQDLDLITEGQELPEDEFGESADDLDLNWEYERPRLSTDAPEDEESEGDDEDADYMSDSDEFRDGIIPDDSNPVRSAFGAITGAFASLTERLREKEPKGDEGEEEPAGEEPGEGDGGPEDVSVEETDSSEESSSSEDAPKKRRWSFGFGGKQKDDPSVGEDESAEDEEEPAADEYDPDEEWKRRMEEPPSGRRKRRKLPKEPLFSFSKKGRKKSELPEEVPAEGNDSIPLSENDQEEAYHFENETADEYGSEPEMGDDYAAESGMTDDEYNPENGRDTGSSFDPDEDDFDRENYGTQEQGQDSGYNFGQEENAGPQSEEEPVPEKSIEVIDLDENTNSKEAEVIPLDARSTGPLPRLKAGRFLSGRKTVPSPAEEAKKKEKKKKSKEPKEPKKPNETWLKIKRFISEHRRQCLIGLAALLVLILAIAAFTLVISKMQSRRRATIREDEGLTIQILSQPDSFTPEGDISLRVKAPETIQSITINGENIDIKQGRTVDLDYHAQTGALEMMVVSTDKVRSADITLAYVDSQPPTVTVSENNGMIELTAEDKETGVKAIYIGRNDGLSDVPTYEEYTEPIPADPDAVFSYYATDEAGNSSAPAVSAMIPATAIAFPQNRYGIFPGSETPLEIVTTPENAFVNNLTYEVENDKVAKVSNGILTGISEGDTKVIASADGLSSVSATVSVKADRSVTISCVGDCTLGTDINLSANTSFNAYQATYGNSYFFDNVRAILSQDDATFANFEGTLTTLDESYRKDKPYAFKADPSYADILTDGSIEVVTLGNNHTYDYGDQSTQDTKDALDAAGVLWCEGNDIAYMDLNGVKTAFIGIYALENGLESMDLVLNTIADAKENGADLIIIHFHWGVELVTTLDDFERQLAHAAIDAGADLVLGTHAHMILPVEKYNGRYIVYGLSNFCFGGNAYPHSYDTIIWQQTFTFAPDGLESEDDIHIIPCSISSDTSINNYQPTPVTGDKAAEIIQTMNSLSTEFGLTFDQYLTDGTQITG